MEGLVGPYGGNGGALWREWWGLMEGMVGPYGGNGGALWREWWGPYGGNGGALWREWWGLMEGMVGPYGGNGGSLWRDWWGLMEGMGVLMDRIDFTSYITCMWMFAMVRSNHIFCFCVCTLSLCSNTWQVSVSSIVTLPVATF